MWLNVLFFLFDCSLGPLVRKVKDSQVELIVNEMCTNMFSEDERLRDISSVGTIDNQCMPATHMINCAVY